MEIKLQRRTSPYASRKATKQAESLTYYNVGHRPTIINKATKQAESLTYYNAGHRLTQVAKRLNRLKA